MIFRSWKAERWISWWIWACTGSFVGRKRCYKTQHGTTMEKGSCFRKDIWIIEAMSMEIWPVETCKECHAKHWNQERLRYIYIYTALFSRVFEYIFSKLHICRYISESLYNFMEVTCIHSLLHSVSTNTQEVTPVPPQRLAAATAISRGGLGSYTCGL